jgi:hypothetical protein
MLKALLVVALATIWWAAVQAQTVYRCVVDGRTTFSQVPCGPDAELQRVSPASGPADESAALEARIRASQARLELQRIDAERDRQRELARREREREQRQAELDKQWHCEVIARERASAERLASRFVVPKNIRREEERARELRTRQFMDDCP